MKLENKYIWTKHSQYKMRYYGLSPQRIKRIIRHPARVEEAIVPNLIAVMAPAVVKTKAGKQNKAQEIWAMYKLTKNQIKVITAWRYPGKSPARNPIPKEILDEIKSITIIVV